MSALTDGKEKNERKIAEIYVGALWQRQIESIFNDRGPCVSGDFLFWRKPFLPVCACFDDLCVFPHVFPEYCQAQCRKPVVSEKRDEGQRLFPEKEKGMEAA